MTPEEIPASLVYLWLIVFAIGNAIKSLSVLKGKEPAKYVKYRVNVKGKGGANGRRKKV